MDDLRGQHIVVTGATGGLGPTVVQVLLACGANVTAVARRRTALDSLRADLRDSDRLQVAEGDVSDGPSTERLFDSLDRNRLPVYGVVHTVGGFVSGPITALEDRTMDDLYRALLLSPVLVVRAALRRMTARRSGRIVLVSSLASTQPAPNVALYAALKAAVNHLTTSAAAEAARDGITVNAILPGVLDTATNRKEMKGADPSRWVAPTTVAKAIAMLLGESGAGINGTLLAIPDRVS